MSGYLNKVTLIGNIGRDPQFHTMKDGARIVHLSVATTEYWKDKATGERKDKTEWHRVCVMNERIADFIERFVRKGNRVFVEGQLQTRKWTDTEGKENFTTEIMVGRFKGDIMSLDKISSQPEPEMPEIKPTSSKKFDSPSIKDDDIPF